jgi:tRNA threonylcarbamoyladenosine biosynthesis protein TsaE
MDTMTTVAEGEARTYARTLLDELIRTQHNEAASIVALTGDLGSGKTTLVQALAEILGVTEVVTSPTFVVMKSYETTHPVFTTLVHVDAYRIDDVSELAPLHFKQILDIPQALICIEWPQRIAVALPTSVHYVSLEAQPDGSRTITYHGI